MTSELRRIKGLGEGRARALKEAGIETLEDLIRMDVEEISERTNIGVGTLREYQAKAKKLLPQVAAEVERAKGRKSWLKRVWEKLAS